MPRESLLDALLSSARRDRASGADPVVPIGPGDPRTFLDEVDRKQRTRVVLERRGTWHGEWAVLRRERTRRQAAKELKLRWLTAKPIVLPGIASDVCATYAAAIRARAALHERLQTRGELRRWIDEEHDAIADAYATSRKRPKLVDPERDVERVAIERISDAGDTRVNDLWLKSSWLSTHDDDASLRLRFSFGREGDDDGSRDVVRHRLVADLAARMLPETAAIDAHPKLAPLLAELCNEAPLLTQTIAYWNAPNGGARFHHDAFGEDALDDGEFRQLGVCFVQLSGASAWLALSIDDLAARVSEFAMLLAQGSMPWVRAQLFEGRERSFREGFDGLLALVRDPRRLRSELALPGCGELGALVDRGPEFTSFLAEAGHASVLEPGDAILLPNFGHLSTAMHSVFCASQETGYALSFALRPDRTAPEYEPRAARPRRSYARGEGA